MILFALAALALAAGAAPAVAAEDGVPVESSLFARCRDGALDADALAGDRAALAAASAVPFGELSDYLACRALAGAAPDCGALDGIPGALGEGASSCRELEREARLVAEALRGGDAAASCRKQFLGKGPDDKIAKACASAVASAAAGDPAGACADLRAAGLSGGKDDSECARNLVYWKGRAADCGSSGDASRLSRCRALAGLVAGLRSKPACAASPLCGALSGGGIKSCAPLRKAASERVCGRASGVAKARAANEREAAKRSAAEAAEAKRQQAAKAAQEKAEKTRKPQFRKGEAMESPVDVKAQMKKAEKLGEPKTGETNGPKEAR